MLITLIDLHCDLVHEWQKLISVPTIADPIPSKYQPGYGRSGQAP